MEEKNSTSSSMVGYIYFNRLKTKCYKLERPIVGCKTDTKYVGNIIFEVYVLKNNC